MGANQGVDANKEEDTMGVPPEAPAQEVHDNQEVPDIPGGTPGVPNGTSAAHVPSVSGYKYSVGMTRLECHGIPHPDHQDNISAMTMASKGKHIGETTRHINIRYFFIKHYLESKEVVLEYLPTESMIADIMTKPLQGALFKSLRAKLLNL
jgi:hypothetical protein